MKQIGLLRKKVARIYNIQFAAKGDIDLRDDGALKKNMEELITIANEVLGVLREGEEVAP